jgi:hypothetical protein
MTPMYNYSTEQRKEFRKLDVGLKHVRDIVKKKRLLVKMATGRSAQNLLDECPI